MRKTKPVLEKTMLAFALDETRGCVRELVRKAEYQTGSRMVAYERVGHMVGMSGMWVRKLIHGYGDVRLLHVTAMNIQEAYGRICERVEQKAENERLKNALAERALELVARLPEAEADRDDGEAI